MERSTVLRGRNRGLLPSATWAGLLRGGASSHSQAFRWHTAFWMTAWLQLHKRPSARTTQLSCSQVSGPQKLCKTIGICCFKRLNVGSLFIYSCYLRGRSRSPPSHQFPSQVPFSSLLWSGSLVSLWYPLPDWFLTSTMCPHSLEDSFPRREGKAPEAWVWNSSSLPAIQSGIWD